MLGADARPRAREPDPAGADELLDAVGADELLEGVERLGRADELEDHRLGAEVGDLRAERLGDREELGPALRADRDLDQRELALDRLARLELADPEDVDELVHLLLDLLQRVLLAGSTRSVIRETSGRSVGPTARLSMLNPRRANIVETRASAPGLFSRRTESVWVTPRRLSAPCTRGCRSTAAPAGIIGKHFSSGSQRASTTAVRPQVSACVERRLEPVLRRRR